MLTDSNFTIRTFMATSVRPPWWFLVMVSGGFWAHGGFDSQIRDVQKIQVPFRRMKWYTLKFAYANLRACQFMRQATRCRRRAMRGELSKCQFNDDASMFQQKNLKINKKQNKHLTKIIFVDI